MSVVIPICVFQTETVVEKTLNVLDKMAAVIIDSSSTNSRPMEIVTEMLGMAVALTNQSGAKLDAGFAQVQIESTLDAAIALQVCESSSLDVHVCIYLYLYDILYMVIICDTPNTC